jgi:hypothetical protein
MNIHVLATCRKPELLPYTTLVFKTLRVGFPAADVTVYLNNLDVASAGEVSSWAKGIDAYAMEVNTIHHKWIEGLIEQNREPFWIVDTDCIFFGKVEDWTFDAPLAGWRIPEWNDAFSGCITRARLHTSLLYLDPVKIKAAVREYESKIADTPFTPKVNLIHPLVIPFKNKSYFYDTCSLLYHAIGGVAFTDEQKEAYAHLNFGTIQDIVLPRLPKEEATRIDTARNVILSNNSWAKGSWRFQEQYYSQHPV